MASKHVERIEVTISELGPDNKEQIRYNNRGLNRGIEDRVGGG